MSCVLHPAALLISVLASVAPARPGNLASAAYDDGKVDLRMPDAVGNLFKSAGRKDRKYGPAGQLLESYAPEGVTRYSYDPEGNLALKVLPDGRRWKYEWNAAGLLAKVVRPDGKQVQFGYDALGRRVWKKYQGKTTKWVWDGNVPVHEWVEVDPAMLAAEAAPAPESQAAATEAAMQQRQAVLSSQPAQGPPAPITWIFEPESFAPIAKLSGNQHHSIITDHLGTPTAMLDGAGGTVWSADISIYGELRNVVGEKQACPFRWPGQYEDAETGLYYNRFRYYDPDAGEYVSQDPIGLTGGLGVHRYPHDPLAWTDPLGLACKAPRKRFDNRPHVLWSGGKDAMKAAQDWATKHGGVTLEMTAGGRRAMRHTKGLADWEMARPVWAKESRLFARKSEGEVHVFVTKAAMNDPDRILNSVEIPALGKNTTIIPHVLP